MIARFRVHCACALAVMFMALGSCESKSNEPVDANTAVVREFRTDGGDVVGRMTLDQTAITTAQRIHVSVEVTAPESAKIESIGFAEALPDDLLLVEDRALSQNAGEHGAVTAGHEFAIEPLIPGEFEIRPVDIVLGEGESAISAATEPIAISVASVLSADDAGGLGEVKSIVEPAPIHVPWWVWVVGGVGTAGLGALLAWILIRRARRRAAQPTYKTAHEIALEQLEALEQKNLVSAGQLERLHDEASLILRRYIEDRFSLHAPERTTEEFLHEARSSARLMDSDVVVLEVFLRQCDMVKFAKFEPAAEQAGKITDAVREFVQRTRSDDYLVAFKNGKIVGRINRLELERVA